MIPQSKTIPVFEGLTLASDATVWGVIDTLGYNYLTVDIAAGTGNGAQTSVTAIQLSEDDTLSTAYADGDPLTATVGAAAASTSAGYILPALSSNVANNYRFNLDLRGRKRYINVHFAPSENTVGIGCQATLSRASDGATIGTSGTAVAGSRLIVSI